MHPALAYVPPDRLRALAEGASLPDRATGSILSADISGFTRLAELLVVTMGLRRGAEQLGHILNQVYEILIEPVERCGGSVISFSGDGMRCWFEGDDGRRAVSCGAAMQAAIACFPRLEPSRGKSWHPNLKGAVAAGEVYRFRLGDPAIQYLDTLAGPVLTRLGLIETLAGQGELIVDVSTASNLAAWLPCDQWRNEPESRSQAVLVALDRMPAPEPPALRTPARALSPDLLQPWVPPVDWLRITGGSTALMTELRPAVALFGRFGELDFATPAAHAQLDAYIRRVQAVVQRYEGILLQVTLGEKGNYFYAAFGAPIAHEDDAARAALAAVELSQLDESLAHAGALGMGIAQGVMRVGAYGSARRRTYGVLGDAVNVAARLMQRAQPREILASAEVRTPLGGFSWRELAPLAVKGKTTPIQAFVLEQAAPCRPDLAPAAALPLVGRSWQLERLHEHLGAALAGRGRVVAITGEAGIGKSRLVAELLATAAGRGLAIWQGECQSYGATTAYLPWQPIWEAIFDLTASEGAAARIARLEQVLGEFDPHSALLAPLLGPVLNLAIPDNDMTSSLDANLRLAARQSVLADYLRSRVRRLAAAQGGAVIVLEDMHWSDGLSASLVAAISHIAGQIPLLIVLTYRPPSGSREQSGLADGVLADEIVLDALSGPDIAALVAAKLEQLGRMPTGGNLASIVERVVSRTQGNPFFIEELLTYLYVRPVASQAADLWLEGDLPISLHSLMLSRIDQLDQSQQHTLKVASVIGRIFLAGWIHGAGLTQAAAGEVLDQLRQIQAAQLIAPEHAATELAFMFNHAITQEVAYESLTLATRTQLHGAIAAFIEQAYPAELEQYVSLLAFHYGRSADTARQIVYFRQAADQAKANYANAVAIDYYTRLLPLLPPAERSAVQRELGEVRQLIGQWPEAEADYRQAMELARAHADEANAAHAQILLGRLLVQTASHAAALAWLEPARATFERLGDDAGLGAALEHLSFVYSEQGQFAAALEAAERHLALARAGSDNRGVSTALGNIGLTRSHLGDLEQALAAQREALEVATRQRDWRRIVVSSNDLAHTHWRRGDVYNAILSLQHATSVAHEIDYREAFAFALGNMGLLYFEQGFFDQALVCYSRALAISSDLGAWANALAVISNVGLLWVGQGDLAGAEQCYRCALTLAEKLNNPGRMAGVYAYLSELHCLQGAYDLAQHDNLYALELARVTSRDEIQFRSMLLSIKLDSLQGQTSLSEARDRLQGLLETHREAEQQAAVYYTRWELDPADEIARDHASRLYRENHERAGGQIDRSRYKQLTGVLLPRLHQPPPLPAFLEHGPAVDMLALIGAIAAAAKPQDLSAGALTAPAAPAPAR